MCAGEMSLAAAPLDSAASGGITSGMTQEDIESIYGPADVLIPYELNRREGDMSPNWAMETRWLYR